MRKTKWNFGPIWPKRLWISSPGFHDLIFLLFFGTLWGLLLEILISQPDSGAHPQLMMLFFLHSLSELHSKSISYFILCPYFWIPFSIPAGNPIDTAKVTPTLPPPPAPALSHTNTCTACPQPSCPSVHLSIRIGVPLSLCPQSILITTLPTNHYNYLSLGLYHLPKVWALSGQELCDISLCTPSF
jgi:hypothetical protein